MHAIVAGPTYVEFQTAEVWPPSGAYHTEIAPRDSSSWAAARTVGGSAWKIARFWAQSEEWGEATILVPTPESGGDDRRYKQMAFVDDARWLKEELEQQERTTQGFHITWCPCKEAIDYTFHLRHPTQQPWPVLSIRNGASASLRWKNIRQALSDHRKARPNEDVVLIFTGILRTNLLHTCAAALGTNGESRSLLEDTKLFIDFGRVNLRPDEHDRKEIDKVRESLEKLPFDGLFVDDRTAETLSLFEPNFLNASRGGERLMIVRPFGPMGGQWKYCRYGTTPSNRPRLETQSFEAPDVAELRGDKRPARVAQLIHDLGIRQPTGKWEPRHTLDYAEGITREPELLAALRSIEERIERDPSFRHLLIYGETGSGKEIISKWVHRLARNRGKPPAISGDEDIFKSYVAVACGRLEGDLLESTLFGHTKGSFTTATRDYDGAFVQAKDGTLLIDDLDNMRETTQAKVLRALETEKVVPVGATQDEAREARPFVIATTNVDPATLVAKRKLRKDFLFRLLAGEYLCLPPVRERPRDLAHVAEELWDDENRLWGSSGKMPQELLDELQASQLEGNFRELAMIVQSQHAKQRRGGKADCLREWKHRLLAQIISSSPQPHEEVVRENSTPTVRYSPLLLALRDRLAFVELSPKEERRLDQLVSAWKTLIADNSGDFADCHISRKQIHDLLKLRQLTPRQLLGHLRRLREEGVLASREGAQGGWVLIKE